MQIDCGTVVSAAGFLETLGEHGLVKQAMPRTLPVLRQLQSSDGFTMCNVSISGCTADELGLTQANVWWQPCVDKGCKGVFQMCEDFFEHPDQHAAPMMLTFPSMKDRSWKIKNPLQHTAQVLILSKASWFESKDLTVNPADPPSWASGKGPTRSPEYMQYKQRWQDESLKVLRELFPKLAQLEASGVVTVAADVSTPSSITHYLAKCDGGATGLNSAPARYTDDEIADALDMKSEIGGLWLTGQDTLLCGQPLVQIAGIITALRVCGFLAACRFGLSAVRHIWYRLIRA